MRCRTYYKSRVRAFLHVLCVCTHPVATLPSLQRCASALPLLQSLVHSTDTAAGCIHPKLLQTVHVCTCMFYSRCAYSDYNELCMCVLCVVGVGGCGWLCVVGVGGCGWLWVVGVGGCGWLCIVGVGGCGWLWVVGVWCDYLCL